MSAESLSTRLPYNVFGKFHVTEDCLDCDLCRETAPTLFTRNADEGTSYLFKQPATAEEHEQAIESLEGCPCEAIHNDGDQHDWTMPPTARPSWRSDNSPKPTCSHCSPPKRPWWKFWA